MAAKIARILFEIVGSDNLDFMPFFEVRKGSYKKSREAYVNHFHLLCFFEGFPWLFLIFADPRKPERQQD